VPGRKLTLFPLRLSRTSLSAVTLALGVPALALAGIAASAGLSAGTASSARVAVRPAIAVRATIPARSAVPAITLSTSQATRSAASVSLLTVSATAVHHRHRLGARRRIAWRMMQRRFGWRPRYQFRYLNRLWDRESSWNIYASNPYSGAYGIPQAVPGSKMATAGRRWRTSAAVQIRWGLRYIKARYGSPRGAWDHEIADGWY
jgi:hypothetical protein